MKVDNNPDIIQDMEKAAQVYFDKLQKLERPMNKLDDFVESDFVKTQSSDFEWTFRNKKMDLLTQFTMLNTKRQKLLSDIRNLKNYRHQVAKIYYCNDYDVDILAYVEGENISAHIKPLHTVESFYFSKERR